MKNIKSVKNESCKEKKSEVNNNIQWKKKIKNKKKSVQKGPPTNN